VFCRPGLSVLLHAVQHNALCSEHHSICRTNVEVVLWSCLHHAVQSCHNKHYFRSAVLEPAVVRAFFFILNGKRDGAGTCVWWQRYWIWEPIERWNERLMWLETRDVSEPAILVLTLTGPLLYAVLQPGGDYLVTGASRYYQTDYTHYIHSSLFWILFVLGVDISLLCYVAVH
jgi:hypothetical protein